MARKCPQCFAALPATNVVVYSVNIECESCNSPLEFSAFSRYLSAFSALIIAAVVFKLSQGYYAVHPGSLGWVFPVLFAFLAYSIAAPIFLVFIADLQLRPLDAGAVSHDAPAPGPASSHSSPHHH